MGRLDLAMKQLMKDHAVFADAFNFRRKAGSQIDPSRLREIDPSVNIVDVLSGFAHSQSSDLSQRLVVLGDESRTCALLLLENQSYIDRLMPLRCLYATALRLREEADAITKRHEKAKDLKDADEFLSGFSKSDRLPHVYISVLYAGKEPWNGPLRLADILVEEDSDCGLYEADCPLNLISLAELSNNEIARFNTNEMKVMATAVRLQDDPTQLAEVSQTNPAFWNVNSDIYNVVRLTSGFELPQPTKPTGNDMKKDITAFKQSRKDEGRNEIVANMLKENMSMSIIEKVTKLSEQQIIQIAKANNIPLL